MELWDFLQTRDKSITHTLADNSGTMLLRGTPDELLRVIGVFLQECEVLAFTPYIVYVGCTVKAGG